MYKITNLTYSPLRVMINGYDKTLPKRPIKNRDVYVEKLNSQLRKMLTKGLIKVKKI